MPLDRRTFPAMSFSAVELIIKKREQGALSTAEINWLVENYTSVWWRTSKCRQWPWLFC